jgi:hypothetical protein
LKDGIFHEDGAEDLAAASGMKRGDILESAFCDFHTHLEI